MDGRLPAHLEVAAIRRLAEAQGGFAAVLAKGERDAGTILLVARTRTGDAMIYERMPTAEGRPFTLARRADCAAVEEFDQYLARRCQQDRDMWVIEVEIADPERFIAHLPG